jgi:hypothetical protein
MGGEALAASLKRLVALQHKQQVCTQGEREHILPHEVRQGKLELEFASFNVAEGWN